MTDLTRSTYDRIAPAFAEVNAEMSENLLAAAQKFLTLVPENSLCLDLGCGSGRDSAWFAQHPLRMIGVDFSLGMLLQARDKVSCPLAQMDMRQTGFAAGAFAAIWCNAALLHLPKAEAPLALGEMRRVLAPGGLLDLSVQQGRGEQLEPNPYVPEQGERFFARYTLPEMLDLLATAGFTALETLEISYHQRTWLRLVARKTG